MTGTHWASQAIAAMVTAGVIVRLFSWLERVWGVVGAVLLVLCGLLPLAQALAGVGKGTDVYLFLLGMVLLAELARQEGLFDWLAAHAAVRARETPTRLFALVPHGAAAGGWCAGLALAFGSNAVNNLPAGLIAARVVEIADVPEAVRRAVLIGVDLGPNLSVTGSLATILWLTAVRREALHVGALLFLELGAVVMPRAMILAFAGALAFG